jgi:uncharacterized protein (TIGR02246 family)
VNQQLETSDMKVAAMSLTVCLGIMAVGCAAPAKDQADEQAIKSVVTDFARSWNLPGMPGFGELFTEDADFVVVTGRWLKGRDEIVSYHRDLLADFYKGSEMFVDAITLRFLRAESHGSSGLQKMSIAVVHTAWGVKYTKDGEEQKRMALGVFMFTKKRGKWKIAAVHNTLTGGPGWSFAASKWIDRSGTSDSQAANHLATP